MLIYSAGGYKLILADAEVVKQTDREYLEAQFFAGVFQKMGGKNYSGRKAEFGGIQRAVVFCNGLDQRSR
mgnify:CR=1 FL=1